MRREWIEITEKIPNYNDDLSPSMRREWIEIGLFEIVHVN